MKLKPDDNWQWFYDNDYDRMMLEINGGLLFCSRFSGKMLIPSARHSAPFSVDDATAFYMFEESLKALNLSSEHRSQLILNSLVVARYLKPIMPKSWYFQVLNSGYQPATGHLVQAVLTESHQTVLLLVVESNQVASLCVLAQVQAQLPLKCLQLGDAIKLMNDRLIPIQSASAEDKYQQVV